jgi:LmbE family N-acetylglucosaminyl deacetylase
MNILIIAAHPDDEVLGCGGTIAKLSIVNKVYTLILGEGVTSRKNQQKKNVQKVKQLQKEAEHANKILGVKKVYFEGLPDNKFDTLSLLNIIKIIERYIQKIKPDVIYTHHYGDLNIDHTITYKVVLTATRPISGVHYPRKILAFEVLSSTEWNQQHQAMIFIPNIYVDISETVEKKLRAMKCYTSEIRQYPHPRSLQGINIHAQKRGLEVGLKFAEAFYLIRDIV